MEQRRGLNHTERVDMTNTFLMEVDRHSSKGNQMKWCADGYWYKADYLGYEALAEVLASKCVEHSNITNYVHYEPVSIVYHDETYRGCRSCNFLAEDEELLTAERLFYQLYAKSLAKELAGKSVPDKISFFVKTMEEITGIADFGAYLTGMLELDAFCLNEDRHMHNIAVIRNEEGMFRLCPLFDQGAGLLSDMTSDFKEEYSLEKCLSKIEAKPFSSDFDEQMDAAEALYGTQIRFSFSAKEAEQWIEEAGADYAPIVRERVRELMHMQMRKYRYLFEKP